MLSNQYIATTSEKILSAILKGLFLSLLIVIGSLITSQYAFAYRPFVSTDADVVDVNEWEIELGLFSISHDEGINEITVPSVIINYGISKTLEVVGEFDVQAYTQGEERNFELKDPVLLLKGVLREGVLQNQKGVSFAAEFAVLLPSTVKEEGNVGIEVIGILSAKILDLVYHLNFGGELEREESDLNGIWGVILEYPFEAKLRLVGEVNGVIKQHSFPDNSGLIGFIWEIGGFTIDFGTRRGFSEAAADWELTTGITFSYGGR